MRWLIFGAKGWIGQQVYRLLESCGQEIFLFYDHINIFLQLKEIIHKINPDRIICCVGRTYGPGFTTIDYLEQAGKLTENLESNLMMPVWIAQATTIPILYFGTGCIYEYDASHPIDSDVGFREDEEPNFTGSSYSAVKRITDKMMSNFPHVINARIRMPIADNYHSRDFITKLLGYSKITSIPNSMTVLSDILPALLAFLYEAKNFGTVNSVNPGIIDHDTILKLHEENTGVKNNYTLEPLEEQNKRLASRRSNNHLDATKLQSWVSMLDENTRQLFGVPCPIPPIEESIRRVILTRRKE